MPVGYACAALSLSLTQPDLRGEGRGGLAPDRILATLPGDPTRSLGVTWRTRGSRGPHRLQIRTRSGPIREVPATTQALEETSFDVGQVHEAVSTDLTPGQKLEYRAASGGFFSDWKPLQTASSQAKAFEFLVFGDAQSKIKAASTPLFEAALRRAPDARLVLHCGDLIDNNVSAAEWGEWSYAMHQVGPRIPSLATPGNHEYGIYGRNKNRFLTPLWRPGFAFPLNGPKGLEETCYWLDYQGVRFISLDSLKPLEPQVKWMAEIPANPEVKWTVVLKHYPVFPSLKGQEAPGRTKLLTQAFERLGVDLVFTGHLHSYARSGLVKGGNFRSKEGGVVYAISVTGGKFYGQDRFPWMSVAFPRVATYQVVIASPESLRVRAYDLKGAVRDDFEITRAPNGQSVLRELLK